MYEFFCGKLPFGEEYEDPLDIYKAVSKDPLEFPKFCHDDDFMELMKKMLNKSPTSRLWKLKQIKEDKYFEGFDWNKLISLSMPPPYKISFKEIKEKNDIIPYLQFLQTRGVKTESKKKSERQLRFDKWLKNF